MAGALLALLPLAGCAGVEPARRAPRRADGILVFADSDGPAPVPLAPDDRVTTISPAAGGCTAATGRSAVATTLPSPERRWSVTNCCSPRSTITQRLCHRSRPWREHLAAADIDNRRTRPHRPQTNGGVLRLNRTLLTEWAYARPFTSGEDRADASFDWLHTYDHHRAHTSLGGRPASSAFPSHLTRHYIQLSACRRATYTRVRGSQAIRVAVRMSRTQLLSVASAVQSLRLILPEQAGSGVRFAEVSGRGLAARRLGVVADANQ